MSTYKDTSREVSMVLEIPTQLSEILRVLLTGSNYSIEILDNDDRLSSKGSSINITAYDMTEEQQIALAMFSKQQRGKTSVN